MPASKLKIDKSVTVTRQLSLRSYLLLVLAGNGVGQSAHCALTQLQHVVSFGVCCSYTNEVGIFGLNLGGALHAYQTHARVDLWKS